MASAIHAFSQEEMMAYFDGELSPERALLVAHHLEQCPECQRLAADFQTVSRCLMGWPVEPIDAEAPALSNQASPKEGVFGVRRKWARPPFGLLFGGAAGTLLLIFIGAAIFGRREAHMAMRAVQPQEYSAFESIRRLPTDAVGGVIGTPAKAPPEPPLAALKLQPATPSAVSGPLIVRNVQLSLTTNNFDRSRSDMERITSMHDGYIAQLQLNSPAGAGRSLTATLRIPAAQLEQTLRELNQLGRMISEWQNAEDVTRQYVDIDARLSNLRTTEQRLLQILRDRTGKLSDVLQVEEAIDRTRGDIDTTAAEQKALTTQIAFASLQLNILEEYKEHLQTTSESTRLRNAAVEGYRNLTGELIALFSFVLSFGPALLVTLGGLFFIGRWLWKKWPLRKWPWYPS